MSFKLGKSRLGRWACCGGGALAGFALAASSAEVSFRNDVMAVLSKAGCNAGACHGNQNGKGGFKLSLRGEDPNWDYQALTRDMFARRTNPFDPDKSLILLKSTTRLSHEGGLRFRPDSAQYKLLRRWIVAGATDDLAEAPKLVRLEVAPQEAILLAPTNTVQLNARAIFSDGSERDVTRMAVYEPSVPLVAVSPEGLVEGERFGETTILVRYLQEQKPVRLAFVPARPDWKWEEVPESNYVDRHVFAKLRKLRMTPSALCGDTEFVRRAHLDLLGLLPTAGEARRFVEDRGPDKRARLIDALLERPEFADFWALKWSDLLRNEEKVLDFKGVQAFHRWIRQSIAEHKPLDQFARELIAGRGSSYDNPAANYYRANRDAVSRAEATAQLFLGARLNCAKCHNHPFDRWTQQDYYDWAALFSRVQYKVLENRRRDNNDQHEFIGEQVVWVSRKGQLRNPRTDQPAQPRFLGESGTVAANENQNSDHLGQLAAWITSDNDRFARAQVNRIWYQLMGKGIVDPIDDFRETNPASNAGLLEALTEDLIGHYFDLRHLIRVIMTSRTYQLSPEPNETNADDDLNFSRALVRRLTAEQLLDAQSQVTGAPLQFNGYPEGTRAAQIAGVRAQRPRDKKPGAGDKFLELFGKPPRLLTCECERSGETSMAQAFQMISGPAIHDLLTASDSRLDKLAAGNESPREMVEGLYWSALSRPPTEAELAKAAAHLAQAGSTRPALEDITWALLNSKEFIFRP